MKDAKRIKVYSFNRLNVEDKVITSEDLEENKITLNESFLTYALEAYKYKELENDELVEEIIKVMLPFNEDDAKDEWMNGLTFNDKKYYAWFATTSGMKKEESGICETLFVREDFIEFAKDFEDLISLGKFKEIEESKEEVCINKDILSRISLGTSSSYVAGALPRFIVLPESTYRIIKDYKTVEKFTKEVEDDEGNKKNVVDYNLVDYHFNDDVEMFDGGAIATPLVFKQIQKELNLNYSVEFAIIRAYGIGIKGMITKFDIVQYLRKNYKGETEYCRIKDGFFELLDMWGDWQRVTQKTMLLNESMVKLAKYFDGMKEYKQRLREVDGKYKDILKKLYVTKVNKNEKDIVDYRRTNYQLMTALALSKDDYKNLAVEDVRAYRKILSSYTKDEDGKWQIDIDAIRLFFKNIVNVDDEEDEEKIYDTLNDVASKCEGLLNIDENFVKLKYVKNNLARLIEKKCRELAAGKLTVKAKYQYIAVDPISYMNFAMYRDQKDNGLNEGEFYSADCEDGDIRTIARNPLCAYSEVHNVKFVRNEMFDKWLSPCKELIYFNQKSDILALMSSADCDGDACTVIDNEIIKNAVVTPKDGKYFINKNDGDKVSMKYTSENRFLATYRASGNLIGSIALKSASINSNSQQTYNYYNPNTKEFMPFSFIDFETDLKERTEEYKEAKLEYIKRKIDAGELMYTSKVPDLHREHIRQRFYFNEKDIYIVLYNAMVSIDSPKTLFFPSKADMKVINDKYPRKAYFLKYKEKKEDVREKHYKYTSGLLDDFSKVVKNILLDKIDEIVNKFDNKVELIQSKLLNGDYKVEDYNDCLKELEEIYKGYTEKRKLAERECWKKVRKEKEHKQVMQDNMSWGEWEDELYKSNIAKFKAEKSETYKEIDKEYIQLADELMKKYDIATISNAIANLDKCTEDFIINLFFPVFNYLNEKLQNNRYVYVKDPNGEIKYMYENYKKIEKYAIDNYSVTQSLHYEEKKRLKVTGLEKNVRARILDEAVVDFIKQNKPIDFHVKKDGDRIILHKDNSDQLEIFKDTKNIQIDEHSLMNCVKVQISDLIKVNKLSLGMLLTEAEVEK